MWYGITNISVGPPEHMLVDSNASLIGIQTAPDMSSKVPSTDEQSLGTPPPERETPTDSETPVDSGRRQ